MVSYSGHVPRSKEIMGTSTKGGLPPFAKEGVPLGQGTEFVTKPKPASTTIMDIAGKKMAMSNAAGKAWIEKNDPYTTTADRATSIPKAGVTKEPKAFNSLAQQGYKVGYKGHVPGVRGDVGSSYWSEQ